MSAKAAPSIRVYALWGSSSTITTVGYGDVFPVTTAGRIVGAITMLVGISTFAVVTAKVAQLLVLDDNPQPERVVASAEGVAEGGPRSQVG